jgi:hypothetical protein
MLRDIQPQVGLRRLYHRGALWVVLKDRKVHYWIIILLGVTTGFAFRVFSIKSSLE